MLIEAYDIGEISFMYTVDYKHSDVQINSNVYTYYHPEHVRHKNTSDWLLMFTYSYMCYSKKTKYNILNLMKNNLKVNFVNTNNITDTIS